MEQNIINLGKTFIFWKVIIKVLERFEDNYDRCLNLSSIKRIARLRQNFKITDENIMEVGLVILDFQNIFDTILKDYTIQIKNIKNQIRLSLVKKKGINNHIVYIDPESLDVFNDTFYYFVRVNHVKGGGFNKNLMESKFMKNLNKLNERFPVLFNEKNSNIIYFSKIGEKLGNILLSYRSTNRAPPKLVIDNYNFIFD